MADPVQNKARKARLAEALRANLKKRRTQSRSRDPQKSVEASESVLESQVFEPLVSESPLEPASLLPRRDRTPSDEP